MAEITEVQDRIAKDARIGAASRSGIASPYFDLAASIALAEAVYQLGGVCSPDQLTAALGYKSTASGTFLTRLAAANKHFSLVEVSGERITVTERGKKILSPVLPEDAVKAKVEAFLSVQLFARVYEQFKGAQLPPEAGLKNLFRNTYAVLPDRVATAVRVFLNSAEQAGFFDATSGERSRLIAPSSIAPAAMALAPEPKKQELPALLAAGPAPEMSSVHSAIVGLLKDLPPPGTEWPRKQKARFVKAFQATLDFVYPGEDED